MSYDETHTEDECDKCLKKVGKENLTRVPFLYLDKNDEIHEDMSPLMRLARPWARIDDGYRQYYVCKDCTNK